MSNKNHVAASATALSLIAALLSPAHAAIQAQDYDTVIQAAREGQARESANTLQSWHQSYPEDKRILHDLIVVLVWSDRPGDALREGSQLKPAGAPSYVLRALGNAGLQEHAWDDAERYFRQALRQQANDREAQAGLALSLHGAGKDDAALALIRASLPREARLYARQDATLFMALGRIQQERNALLDAAEAYRQASRLDPVSREAFRAYVFSLNAAGMPYLASRIADSRITLFSNEERQAIAHAAAGATINYGQAQLSTDPGPSRFNTTDAGIADNASVMRHFGNRPVTQFDRMIALRDRQRMQEVVDLYEQLQSSQQPIPSYAQAAAADAYLYLQQPVKARDLYLSALSQARSEDRADTDGWRIGLTYAYSEAEQHTLAQQTADTLLAETPKFSNRGIPGIEAPNDAYPTVATLTALVRMYADRLDDVERRLDILNQTAPFNSQIRTARSELHMSRGQPRAALENYRLLQVDQPEELAPALGIANARLALQEFGDAQQMANQLARDYPENKGVQRLNHLLDVHDRPYLDIDSTFGRGGGQAGAESVVEARLYSKPLTESLGEAWRIYGRLSRASGEIGRNQPNSSNVSRLLAGAGIDYRVRDWTTEAELNSAFHHAERQGVAVQVIHDFSDYWRVSLKADTNVNDLSARAFNADIHARRVTGSVAWRANESRRVDAEIATTQFSDSNRRDAAGIAWTERWISGPVFKLDGITSLSASRNSLDNAVYFNPSSDRELGLRLESEWLTWRRYQRSFTQTLHVWGGRYKQENFATGTTSGAQYGHRWAIDDALRIEYGVGLANHPYDGVRERRTYGYLNLKWAIK
ncbi:poly-beta-1,6 N-acetyl-D-glucosamine export porin PgaA [uncultured Oxalicibacterium sp.]|uniref:poly-beta-1,6 N-acetyl-D-glucosamine export porin PgaA n=1 Tax=uncultured Oxalicibacterium sp. TaxID=1168540 RepID=UPI0025DA9A08|nr:poly-beta-1,6 N-acetyl-D-glucosamine export porin PgaA [uncultured Oxalicibacterium sp.]